MYFTISAMHTPIRPIKRIRRIVAFALLLVTLAALAGCQPPGGMAPAQKVADDFGMTVRYDRSADTVTLRGGGRTVVATTGSDLVMVDGRLERLGRFVAYNGAEVFFPVSIYEVLRK